MKREPGSQFVRPVTRAPQTAPGRQPSVELHIGELVLDGFESAQRHAIGDAFEKELGRLFTEQGVPASMVEDLKIERLNGGEINLTPGAEDAGIQLARTIYGRWDK